MSDQSVNQFTERYFEEIDEGESRTLDQVRTITETDVVNFAGISSDFHPMHMSETFSELETGLSERVAHGNLVFSIVSALASGVNLHSFSYGYDDLRFVQPVYIGTTLTIHREIIETTDYNDTLGRVTKKYEAENQNGETVLSVNHISLVKKQPVEDSG